MAKHKDPISSAAIAYSIKKNREKMFPGRGSQMKCAQAFSKFAGENITNTVWSDWENNRFTPSDVRLQKLAEFFGVSVSELRGENSAPSEASGAEVVTGWSRLSGIAIDVQRRLLRHQADFVAGRLTAREFEDIVGPVGSALSIAEKELDRRRGDDRKAIS